MAVRRRAREGKIKQAEFLALFAPADPDADVLGFDVPVGHAFLVQVLDATEQVFAKLPEHGEVEGAFRAQLAGERGVAGALHREALEFAKFEEVLRAGERRPAPWLGRRRESPGD